MKREQVPVEGGPGPLYWVAWMAGVWAVILLLVIFW